MREREDQDRPQGADRADGAVERARRPGSRRISARPGSSLRAQGRSHGRAAGLRSSRAGRLVVQRRPLGGLHYDTPWSSTAPLLISGYFGWPHRRVAGLSLTANANAYGKATQDRSQELSAPPPSNLGGGRGHRRSFSEGRGHATCSLQVDRRSSGDQNKSTLEGQGAPNAATPPGVVQAYGRRGLAAEVLALHTGRTPHREDVQRDAELREGRPAGCASPATTAGVHPSPPNRNESLDVRPHARSISFHGGAWCLESALVSRRPAEPSAFPGVSTPNPDGLGEEDAR